MVALLKARRSFWWFVLIPCTLHYRVERFPPLSTSGTFASLTVALTKTEVETFRCLMSQLTKWHRFLRKLALYKKP